MACTCSRQNSLLMQTIVKPRYCSPRPICRSRSSPIFWRAGRVNVLERSRVWLKLLDIGSGVEENFHCQGGLLDTRRHTSRPAPAAVRILRGQEPGDAAPGAVRVHLIEVAIGG